MITIFTIPRQFKGIFDTIQRNGIKSWLKLEPKCEVILLGDDEGVGEFTREIDVRHIPDVTKNEYGTPLLDSLYEKAQKAASNEIMAYVNPDIILNNDFTQAVSKINWKKFVMIGRRRDLKIENLIDFDNSDWKKELRERLFKEGTFHAPTAIDYFIFSKYLWPQIPPFAIGRRVLDNWLIYKARKMNYPVVDATEAILCVHQNHEHSYSSLGKQSVGGEVNPRKSIEAERNIQLAGGLQNCFLISDANWVLTKKGMRKPKLSLEKIRRYFATLPAFHPGTSFLSKWIVLFLSPKELFLGIKKRLKNSLNTSRD